MSFLNTERMLSGDLCSCSMQGSGRLVQHDKASHGWQQRLYTGLHRKSRQQNVVRAAKKDPNNQRQAFKGSRVGHRAFDNSNSKLMQRMEREMRNELKFIPDRLSDPLLDIGNLSDPYALPGGNSRGAQQEIGQSGLRKKEGVTVEEWDDALTVGELKEKYARQFWLEELQERAMDVHHEQRMRGTVPSYGQALALGNLMEQMHLEEDTVDADQIPTWIRAHFMMEERWGELEAEHQAAAQAVQLAESWGMSAELQDKIDNFDPSLFEGEPDAPAEPDVIDQLLDGVLPGTAGYVDGGPAQRDYMMDILPEGPDDE